MEAGCTVSIISYYKHMRKIIVLEFMTLDGVIQAPGGSKEDASEGFKYGGWMGTFFDDAGGKIMAEQMAGNYDLLLGRKTYDIFANYWPTHAESGGWPQVNRITKYVVSKTLKKGPWKNTVVLKNLKDIKSLKEEDGPPLQIYGSGNLIQALLKNGLVDELWLKIFPITLGTGKKLFEDGTIPQNFKLLKTEITPLGVIAAKYKRVDGKIKLQDVD